MHSEVPKPRRLTTLGVAMTVLAVTGWLVTMVVSAFVAQPDTVEDLSAAWKQAGPIPLGETADVTVPGRQTLVAFLVGTQLRGTAGTTSGTCGATSDGRRLDLGWPVHVNPSLTAILKPDQEVVAIAGWTNPGDDPIRVDITCTTSDSTVEHFVAVPSRTAALESGHWFQPWGWVALGMVGLTAAGLGLANRPTR